MSRYIVKTMCLENPAAALGEATPIGGRRSSRGGLLRQLGAWSMLEGGSTDPLLGVGTGRYRADRVGLAGSADRGGARRILR